MNHLACGGLLQNSCKAMFKSTPNNIGIAFKIQTYPKDPKVTMPPPIQTPLQHFKRLYNGNLRAICGGISGSGTRGEVVNITSY